MLDGNVCLELSGRRAVGVLQTVTNLLLANCIGDLGSATEEIEVPANGTSAGVSPSTTTTEGVIVELVLVVIELVT